MRLPVPTVALAALSLILLSNLAAVPAAAERLQGTFRKGVYTAPAGLFMVQSPLGTRPAINDGYNNALGIGSVSFMSDLGKLYGVVYGPKSDPLAATTDNREVATAILRNWFREGIFPTAFEQLLPGSKILRDEAGEFEGQPAWIAVVYLPGGHALASSDPATHTVHHYDSWRGVVIVSNSDHSYALMKELNDNLLFGPGLDRFQFDPAATNWNAFVPELAEFYRGIQFQKP